ncbi:uncharacterized protein LOC132868100 [Neoarius graeffei]|uniref:uncharacterized protein LOC132868100 n=1 Tax=Neoarius graeffei TaxID=443677 RepID=UPI00298C8CFC|nr:uncharacterized protein LOC132868100 [Neoarius graeffei]
MHILKRETVEMMARTLLDALSKAASVTTRPNAAATTHTPATPVSTPSVTIVNQALKRQFPNMFQTKHEPKRRKGRFSTSVRSSPAKTINLTIFALPGPTTHTPKSSKELELVHAGLGRRLVTLTEDCKHADIVTQIENEFKKFRPLEGRWMFFKAAGGCGQRKLSAVPMDTEGYSGQQLCAVTNNGKNHLFLVPLQEELDMEPLPYDSAEFERMPQVLCLTCNATMPLQMLALHAANCQPTVNVQDDEVVIEDDTEEQGVCPVCQKEFPIEDFDVTSQVT